MKKYILSIFLLALPILASAYDCQVDGIYYNLKRGNVAEVTNKDENYNSYSGVIDIPEKFTYEGIEYYVTSIGEHAFSACSGMEAVTIPNTVTKIGEGAFFYCYSLSSVNIPNSVISIGDSAFGDCRSLTSVTISNSLIGIGMAAFSGCSSLTSISIPSSVTSIGDFAFSSCSSLATISVERGNTTFDSRNDCNAIIETTTNTLIAGCRNTVIPSSVTKIGDYAFRYCENLTTLTIPNSITSIGERSFEGCISLVSVIIPDGVTSLGKWSFCGCSNLASVTIPHSMTSIGSNAFENCTGLESIISKMEVPCFISSYCFPATVFSDVTLYVPKGTKDIYISADYWKKFVHIEEVEYSGVGSANVESIPLNISAQDGIITVKSKQEGQPVAVYTFDGKALGNSIVSHGLATIITPLLSKYIAVVKIGNISVKVFIE